MTEISIPDGKQRTEVRQASLITAALQLAAQRSPADITTADLARAVGITQGAVFRHFASKEAIWLAVMDWTTETLMARLEAASVEAQASAAPAEMGAGSTGLTVLRAVFMAHVGFVIEQPGVPRVLFQELQRAGDTALKARVRLLMHRYRNLLLDLLQRALAQKALRADLDLESAVVLFIGSVQGLVMQALISGHVSTMAVRAPGVFDLVQGALCASQHPPGEIS